MKIIRFISLLLFIVTLTSCSIDKQTISTFVAKEMCSCLFLVEQSQANCKSALGPSTLLGKFSVNQKLRQVTGTANDGSSPVKFQYLSARYGCEMVR